ncbi:MAG: hypothetical protein AAF560_10535 [Acidobacteriota bacterium]
MLDKLQKRERALLGVLVLLFPIGLWQVFGPMLQRFAQRDNGGGVSVGTVQQRAVARQQIADLRLEALDVKSGEYEPERNLFLFGRRPPPPPPPRVERGPAPPPPPPPPPPRPRDRKPKPPPVDVTLLGLFGPERQRIAVLTDPDGAIINAQLEEIVREKFIVHSIGLESVDLTFVGFPDEPPVRLEIGG